MEREEGAVVHAAAPSPLLIKTERHQTSRRLLCGCAAIPLSSKALSIPSKAQFSFESTREAP